MREERTGFDRSESINTDTLVEYEDFDIGQPTPEEEAEAAFYFFIQDLNHYAQNGKFGPRIWNSVSEETRRVLTNQVVFRDVGPKFQWSAICTYYGFSLDDVATANLKKLEERKQRNTISGSGDSR